MVYSDVSTRQGIIQAEEGYCELGYAGISGDANLLLEFLRFNNTTLSKIWSWIFTSAGDWKYDDGNKTNLPQATQDLTSGTFKYALPTDALTVDGVSIKDANGVWTRLIPMTENEWVKMGNAIGDFGKNSGVPSYYMLKGLTIILDNIPAITVTSGLKVYFSRGSVAFTSGATSTTPGFASEFHYLVAVGGSIEWLKVHKPNSAVITMLINDWTRGERDIKEYYGLRWRDNKPQRLTAQITEFR